MTDGELVRQCLSGRADAYEHLVRRWTPRVLAVCHARVRRPDVAEELAQESLFRGYKGLATLAEPEKFGQWLCGVATRVCLDWLKASERKTVPFSALRAEDEGRDSFEDRRSSERAEPVEAQEERERLMDEVQRLPEKHREVLMLYYYEDCTYQQLAEMLGVSAATVNARLTQARQMLRERLTEPAR